jgi:hypothetical protein
VRSSVFFLVLYALVFLACSNSEVTFEIMTRTAFAKIPRVRGSIDHKVSTCTGQYKEKHTHINLYNCGIRTHDLFLVVEIVPSSDIVVL